MAGAMHSVLLGALVAKVLAQKSKQVVANNILNFFILIPHIAPVKRMS
ncbi:hypothetical protein XBI1_3010035 [Xenorhabdus bovienii str. Intermedium]|uniref:Uncharacterized protein n=1 Tax=Xenorhabdus bovienii str. Intermedium TaxID=1379677 RepID=A0A077QPJ8_XENBV|nr:hypothetical protein XBI1_3010035 [Xenorhabdus bovienii str. Intermedium]